MDPEVAEKNVENDIVCEAPVEQSEVAPVPPVEQSEVVRVDPVEFVNADSVEFIEVVKVGNVNGIEFNVSIKGSSEFCENGQEKERLSISFFNDALSAFQGDSAKKGFARSDSGDCSKFLKDAQEKAQKICEKFCEEKALKHGDIEEVPVPVVIENSKYLVCEIL